MVTGCGRRPTDDPESQIKAALARLLQRDATALPGEDGLPGGILRPSVVFEEVSTKKFVQFTGARNESLTLDFPTSSLNADERKRAEAFFAALAARPQRLLDEQHVYTLHVGTDTNRAAQLAMRVFREIYVVGDGIRLRTQEN